MEEASSLGEGRGRLKRTFEGDNGRQTRLEALASSSSSSLSAIFA
jgi:hypothetical protein